MALNLVGSEDWDTEVLGHDGWVIVDFYADWCGPCRWLAPLLERFAEQNADRVKIVKLDTDRYEALSEQYGVQKIPTLVAFRNGQEVRRAINPQTPQALETLISDAG
jgi:thioredoxin 1